MNLARLDRQFANLLTDLGADPEHPSPLPAWQAVIRLATVPAGIDDPGDDFLRFEASTEDTVLGISLSRELTQRSGDLRGAVGCDFRIRLAHEDASVEALIESATEPDFLPLDVFVERVEATRAFTLLMSSTIERAARWSDVTVG